MAECGNGVVGVDNAFGKKFDREEYLQRAREREAKKLKSKSKGPPVQWQPLKHRDYNVNLKSLVGNTRPVNQGVPLNQQAGFRCSVCRCVVNDANYLDHINGKKHQRALGMSMREERASLEKVKQRFELHKKRKDNERILKQKEEEKESKRQRRREKKLEREEERN